MNEYDSDIRNHKSKSLDENTLSINRILIESAWVCPVDPPIPPKPPDIQQHDSKDDRPISDEDDDADRATDDDDADRVGLLYKYHLHLQAKRLSQKGQADQAIFSINGLSDGNDWTYNTRDDS